MKTTIILTALGPVRLASENGALLGLWFRGQKHEPPMPPIDRMVSPDSDPALSVAGEWLNLHLAGSSAAPMPPLAPQGSTFQQEVWTALRLIPKGETISYGSLARSIGRPSATRAVAAAVGRNPISVMIPCHRVVGGDGSLTGYAGGLGRKRALLALEQGRPLPWTRVTKAQYQDPIAVEIGDRVEWQDCVGDGEFAGWLWVRDRGGSYGWLTL